MYILAPAVSWRKMSWFFIVYSPKIWFWVPDNFTTNKKHYSTTIKLLTIKCASTMFYMHVTLRLLRSSHCNWKLQFHPQPWNVTIYFQSWVLTKKNTPSLPPPRHLHFACLKIALDHVILFWNVWKLRSCLKLPFWMSVEELRKAPSWSS